jgi:hypothetical protein
MPSVDIDRIGATICSGSTAGSKSARNVVGVPATAELNEITQKESADIRWQMTSRASHASQRVMAVHWSGVSCSSASTNRRRWRAQGSTTAPSSGATSMSSVPS